ncbi:hypothetical protein E2562_007021 [Oryza meyeriana var. granulata]|uniref:Uncharacterized protein n=1 Tax=Oryza meyeriana var. granulata TaxID=110450 RepID=A0A6G1EC28_9ORYZ|nr:hypothetical protein E2562_007021 [Oryza meyeriana var. granulata]
MAGPQTSVITSRPRARGTMRSGTCSLDEHCFGLGTPRECPSVGGLAGVYHYFELSSAWAGSEAPTMTSKTLGSKPRVLRGYHLSPFE